ncbi:MAG: hypothetical protein M3R03_09270, partial [Pseudomonadota bacterium]|nr:hypothetical protein [Pseudomonadota bacterium]
MSLTLQFVRTHWYAPVFLAMVAGAWWLARSSAFMSAGGEAALLIDLCLTAPILYILCYARKQPLRATIVRALAIACGSVWIATWLIPMPDQVLLPQLAPLRWIGLGLVCLVEIRLLVAAIRIAFSGTGTAEDIARANGAP